MFDLFIQARFYVKENSPQSARKHLRLMLFCMLHNWVKCEKDKNNISPYFITILKCDSIYSFDDAKSYAKSKES